MQQKNQQQESHLSEITRLLSMYHALSPAQLGRHFPVTLTFYTQSDAYDVIHIPEEKEMLMNHALSAYKEDAPRRIAIVDNAGQIPLLDFPGTAAFCTVAPGGEVQYYRKQGVTDT